MTATQDPSTTSQEIGRDPVHSIEVQAIEEAQEVHIQLIGGELSPLDRIPPIPISSAAG